MQNISRSLSLPRLPAAVFALSLACAVPVLGQAPSATAGEAQAFNAKPGGALSAGTSAGVLPLFPQDSGASFDNVVVPSDSGYTEVIPSGNDASLNARSGTRGAAGALKSASVNGSGICFQPGVGWVMAAAAGSSMAVALAGSGANLSATSTAAQTMMTDASSSGASIQPRAIAGASAAPMAAAAQDALCPLADSATAMPGSMGNAGGLFSGNVPSAMIPSTVSATSYSGGASNPSPWMPKAGTSEPTSPDAVMAYVSSHPFLAPSEIQELREQLDDFQSRRKFDDMITARDAQPKKKKTCDAPRDSEEQTGLFANEKEHGDDESCSSSEKSHGDRDTDSDKKKSDGWLGGSSSF